VQGRLRRGLLSITLMMMCISLTQTNIPVHNLAELQDIDDLVVEEGEPQPLPPSATSHLRSPAHKLGGTSARKVSGGVAFVRCFETG
jgi:hypothetical protein